MGLGTIYLLCFAAVVLICISGDRGVHHPNNSPIDYLNSSRSFVTTLLAHTLSAVLILLAVNPISSDRSKHIRVRHLRVREYVEHDEMDVQWVGTKEMLADGLTKTLPGPALSDLRDKLHLRKS